MRGVKLHRVTQELQVNETQVYQALLYKRMKDILSTDVATSASRWKINWFILCILHLF